MKNAWLIIIVIILIVGAGVYLGRHKIKSMMGMGTAQPSMQTQTTMLPTQSTSMTAPTNNIYMTKTDSAKGVYLTDFQGMTLYTYAKDTTGVSNCTSSCATAWPQYSSGATAQKMFPANISVIKRTDGSTQFAWKGMPLYYYANDKKAGDIAGDGIGGIWHLVKP